jgi:hypothetical protein
MSELDECAEACELDWQVLRSPEEDLSGPGREMRKLNLFEEAEIAHGGLYPKHLPMPVVIFNVLKV